MRMLTAVLKDNQIQEFIKENEDSAFDSLKSNLKLEDIYNHIVENINSFIDSESNLEDCYEGIKSYSRNYTLNILNEGVVAPEDARGWFGALGVNFMNWLDSKGIVLTDGWDDRIGEFYQSDKNIAQKAATALQNEDKHEIFRLAQVNASKNPNVNETSGADVGVFGNMAEKLGLKKYYDEVIHPLMVAHQKLIVPIAIVGLMGIMYIAYKKKFGKK